MAEKRMFTIDQWPAGERPREKLLSSGPGSLSDAELLAIFLRTGCNGSTAVDLARHLINEFGSLRALIDTDEQAFCHHRGLGPAKYAQLQAMLEMSRRYLYEGVCRGDVLSSPVETKAYLISELRSMKQEVFACLFLDNRNRTISFEVLFHGTINSASVYPREVVNVALSRNAAAVILVHNHPSGVAEPSRADEMITERLRDALGLVDIRVLDHIIIGDDVVSFSERGLL